MEPSPSRGKSARLIILIVAGVVVLLGVLFSGAYFLYFFSHFRPYKIGAESMCPTICRGERVVAEKGAYVSRNPQRGELIVLELPEEQALLIKRVIGVAGDTVEPGPKNEVMVNGKALKPPGICGRPPMDQVAKGELPGFPPTKVPKGYFFVVGDNLANSNDSRYPEFGLVSVVQLREKPVFIYWSPNGSRIGCKTQ